MNVASIPDDRHLMSDASRVLPLCRAMLSSDVIDGQKREASLSASMLLAMVMTTTIWTHPGLGKTLRARGALGLGMD